MGIQDKVTEGEEVIGDLKDDTSLRQEGKDEERKGEKKEELDRAEERADDKAAEVADLERKTESRVHNRESKGRPIGPGPSLCGHVLRDTARPMKNFSEIRWEVDESDPEGSRCRRHRLQSSSSRAWHQPGAAKLREQVLFRDRHAPGPRGHRAASGPPRHPGSAWAGPTTRATRLTVCHAHHQAAHRCESDPPVSPR